MALPLSHLTGTATPIGLRSGRRSWREWMTLWMSQLLLLLLLLLMHPGPTRSCR